MSSRARKLLIAMSLLVILQTGLNVWLSYQCRWFANKAMQAQADHLRTLEEDERFVEELRAHIRAGKAKDKHGR